MKTHFLFSVMAFCISSYIGYAQYTDLPHNLEWTGGSIGSGTATTLEIESGFNTARNEENSLLGTGFVLGTNYSYNGNTFDYSALSVFNIIDPKPNWEYPVEPIVIETNINTENCSSLEIHDKTLYVKNTQHISEISVFSVCGSILTIAENTNPLPLRELQAGIYLIKIGFSGHYEYHKIVLH